ncbi:MAG: hypothetical protein ACI4KA_10555 [Oscillospiraceae bacterium]
MKKFSPFIIAAVMLCASCTDSGNSSTAEADNSSQTSSATQNTSVTASDIAEVTGEASADNGTSSELTVQETEAASFKEGVWLSRYNGTPSGYYIMYSDGKGGRTLGFEVGTGVGFEYELGADEVMFHYGDALDNTPYTITENTADKVSLKDADGAVLEMTYDGTLDPDALEFYSNMQLCEMALSYYSALTGYTPSSVASQTNEDGTVTIQLYDNLGDHNSTSAWYTVDRFTAEGTDDITGERIALAEE